MAVSSPPGNQEWLSGQASSAETAHTSSIPRAAETLPERIAERYLVREELGRGGLAVVYRVFDTVRGRDLALKQLAIPPTHRAFRVQAAAFEREYHTLMQLSHPLIIEVYDFGADEGGRFYTMELLGGGDLRERSPLPWREACALTYDVCSSLALLHSRRMVHRDISPRNVRMTLEGTAKLIDFGALSPMGPTAQVIGTPPFVPPEVIHRSTLDGRTDLFSLGATLYYALTGQLAYPARHLASLQRAWKVRPPPPSSLVPNIPPALDALVFALISLDPAARPRSAFEVMQRVSSIAELDRVEDASVSQAYLEAPGLVGRDDALRKLRSELERTIAGRGHAVLVEGVAGVGRSRLLDACALECKIAGAAVLRVNAATGIGDGPLAVGGSLAQQLLETAPELALSTATREQVVATLFDEPPGAGPAVERQPTLKQPPTAPRERSLFQSALSRWLLSIARDQGLVILVDDVHRADQASLALIATLALSAPRLHLLVVATTEHDAAVEDAEAFAVLRRECLPLELAPLSREDAETLVVSLFGEVANIALVAERVFEVARGNPRETMELVQALVAQGTIAYRDGRWLLPPQLSASELPSGLAETCRTAVAGLSPLARLLGQVHALASHPTLSRNDYALLASDYSAGTLDAAISELLLQRVLVGDGHAYVIARREWSEALLGDLDDGARRERHVRLAALYAQDEQATLEHADHLMAAGDEAAALDIAVPLMEATAGDSQGLLGSSKMAADQVALLLDRALAAGQRLGRKPRELHTLRRAVVAVSVATDEGYYQRVARDWFAQLEQDSGLALYRSMSDVADPRERLTRALAQATERYGATPQDERVWSPEEAIRGLAYYVAISIALGSRMQDSALISSLPEVLEPFAPLSPVLNAIWQNSIATRETTCDNVPERARERWLRVLEDLSSVSAAELSYVEALRRAIIYGIGIIEARMGFPTAEQTVRMLEDDPMQAVSATSLRQVVRLHKGDFAGAERFRRLAEQLALHSNVRSMFSSTLQVELTACALASDLTGIEQVARSIESLAGRFPGWVAYKYLAQGYFEQARGRFEVALSAFDEGLARADAVARERGRSGSAWPKLAAAAIEVLVSLGRAEEAKLRGERALELCARHRIEVSAFCIVRALALAEAKLGDYAAASRRLETLIEDMKALGVTGLELGATYEARARIAIWFSDESAIAVFGGHTAREYRYGEGSSLGARYEHLMDEARGTGGAALPQLVDFQTKMTTSYSRTVSAAVIVQQRLAGAKTADERAGRALQLLGETRGAHSGHLYLQTDRGLERVASLGDETIDPELDDVVQRMLYEVAQADVTGTVTGTSVSCHDSTCWTDASGRRHQTLLLVGQVEGTLACVGAAVMETAEQTVVNAATHQLLGTLVDYLLRAGDIRRPARHQ